MTKEDYQKVVAKVLAMDLDTPYNLHKAELELMQIFKSNVCIPKGENRHPRCDLIHQWAEDITIKFSAGGREYGEHVWHPSICDIIKGTKQIVNLSARIKPSEPIYEYKWRVGCMFGIDTVTEQFLTEVEVEGTPFLKLEETKQVRQ